MKQVFTSRELTRRSNIAELRVVRGYRNELNYGVGFQQTA